MFTIKKLFNIKNELEDIYHECVELNKNCYDSIYFNQNDNSSVTKVEKLYFKAISHIPNIKYVSSSFWSNNIKLCSSWHVDKHPQLISMVIATYPAPTQILLHRCQELVDMVRSGNCSKKNNDEIVQHYIDMGKAEIFTPQEGDVYLLSANVIHRSNPDVKNHQRIVTRIWVSY